MTHQTQRPIDTPAGKVFALVLLGVLAALAYGGYRLYRSINPAAEKVTQCEVVSGQGVICRERLQHYYSDGTPAYLE